MQVPPESARNAAIRLSIDDETRINSSELQLPIYATRDTAEMLAGTGIPYTIVEALRWRNPSSLEVRAWNDY